MKHAFIILSIILLVATLVSVSTSQQVAKPTGDLERTVALLESAATRTPSLEAFGYGVAQQALRAAAAEMRERGALLDTVELEFTCLVRWVPPDTPQPPEKGPELPPHGDCWEVCMDSGRGTAVQCYVNCDEAGIRP